MNRAQPRSASPRHRNGALPPAAKRALEPAAARARKGEPTGNEVRFGTEEIIVSKTDLSGRITYANDVFTRVSGYSAAELAGQPHSIVRHPDMPRCIFKLLWEAIQSGREVFAYIVNLARNGDHYWVFAHVTPSFDASGSVVGYHSNRRCPDRAQVEKARELYERLIAEERRQPSKVKAAEASGRLLEQILRERQQTYEQFVFSF